VTVLIVGVPDAHWVSELSDALRRHELKATVLENLAVVGLLVLSERIAAVVVNDRAAPAGWEVARARLAQISPRTRIVRVTAEDRSSLDEIAAICAEPP
jgi:hypothetical protein